MGMVSNCKQTPNMDPPKGLSIAHWKALGESYLLSHKSSSGGSMKELWPLEENTYIYFLFYGETERARLDWNLEERSYELLADNVSKF